MLIDDTFFREIPDTCWDAAARLEACDRDGVRVQVLSTVPVMFSYWAKPPHALELSRFLNDHIAATVAAHPGRFAGLGTVPLQAPDLAVAELERGLRAPGLPGGQRGRHVNARNLDHPAPSPVCH